MGTTEMLGLDYAFWGEPWCEISSANTGTLDYAFWGEPWSAPQLVGQYTATWTVSSTASSNWRLGAALFLAATITAAATSSRLTAIARSVSASAAATTTRLAQLVRFSSAESNTSSIKRIEESLTTTGAHSVSWATLKVALREWAAATAGSTATLRRAVSRSLAAAATSSAAFLKRAAIAAGASASATASTTRLAQLARLVTAGATASWAMGLVLLRTLSATASASAGWAKAVSASLSASASHVVDWFGEAINLFALTLSTSAAGAASWVKQARLNWTIGSPTILGWQRHVTKIVTSTAGAAGAWEKLAGKWLAAATAGATASFLRGVGRVVATTASNAATALKFARLNWAGTGFSSAAISRLVTKTIGAAGGVLVDWAAHAVYVYRLTVTAASAAVASTVRGVSLVRSATAAHAASLARALSLGWVYVSAGLVTFRKAVTIALQPAQSTAVPWWITPFDRVGRLIARFWLRVMAMASAYPTVAVDAEFEASAPISAGSRAEVAMGAEAGAKPTLSATLRLTVVPGVPDEGKNR